MAHKVIQLRRGTTQEHQTFFGAPGELTVDTDKWTVVVHDGQTVGGHPLRLDATKFPRVRYLFYRAAAVQQGAASLGFSSPLNNGPEAIVISDDPSGVLIGAASFANNTNQVIQDHFMLPYAWVSPLDLDILWRTDTSIGTVTWLFESCCVPAGSVLENISFGPVQKVDTITSGIPKMVSTSSLDVDTSLWNPNNNNSEVFFRLTRDGADDTVDAAVELLSLRFAVRISEK